METIKRSIFAKSQGITFLRVYRMALSLLCVDLFHWSFVNDRARIFLVADRLARKANSSSYLVYKTSFCLLVFTILEYRELLSGSKENPNVSIPKLSSINISQVPLNPV